MLEVDPSRRARRSGFVPLCAALLAFLGGLWMLPGCLNPLPDDQPSYREVPAPGAGEPSSPSLGQDGEPGAGAGMSPENPSAEEEAPPTSNPDDDLTPDAEPQPDAGVPEAGVADDEDPEAGTFQ